MSKAKVNLIKKTPEREDNYVNLFSGSGLVGTDKSAGGTYVPVPLLSQHSLQERFLTDWVTRKVVNKPASDATKRFISIVEEESELADQVEVLKLQLVIKRALILSRLYGGAVVATVLGDGQLPEVPVVGDPLVKSLVVLERWEVHPLDCASVRTAEYFRIGSEVWHRSRLHFIFGAELTKEHALFSQGWGGSVIDPLDNAVMQLMLQYNNMGHIMAEHGIATLKTRGFANAGSGGSVMCAIQKRLNHLACSKSAYRTVMLDDQEDYGLANRPLTGITDITDSFMTQVSAASGIPETILFGRQAGGLNSSQETQLETYYDLVADTQTDASPAVGSLLRAIAAGANQPPPKWSWLSPRELTEVEAVDVRIKRAEALALEKLTLALSPAEARAIAKVTDTNYIFDDLSDEPDLTVGLDHLLNLSAERETT